MVDIRAQLDSVVFKGWFLALQYLGFEGKEGGVFKQPVSMCLFDYGYGSRKR